MHTYTLTCSWWSEGLVQQQLHGVAVSQVLLRSEPAVQDRAVQRVTLKGQGYVRTANTVTANLERERERDNGKT